MGLADREIVGEEVESDTDIRALSETDFRLEDS